MGFRILFYRISKLFEECPWQTGRSFEINCKKLQFLVANYSKYLDSSFKIQGSEKTCSIQPLWIQDSNLRLRKNFFNPTCLDSRFKIQGSEKTSSIQPLWIQDSRFKASKKSLHSHRFGFKIQNSRLKAFRFKKFFGILNLESYPLGFKKSFWDLES